MTANESVWVWIRVCVQNEAVCGAKALVFARLQIDSIVKFLQLSLTKAYEALLNPLASGPKTGLELSQKLCFYVSPFHPSKRDQKATRKIFAIITTH